MKGRTVHAKCKYLKLNFRDLILDLASYCIVFVNLPVTAGIERAHCWFTTLTHSIQNNNVHVIFLSQWNALIYFWVWIEQSIYSSNSLHLCFS